MSRTLLMFNWIMIWTFERSKISYNESGVEGVNTVSAFFSGLLGTVFYSRLVPNGVFFFFSLQKNPLQDFPGSYWISKT